MLWVKSFHVLAVIGWVTGVFYIPRLLVNYAEAEIRGEDLTRLRDMAKRLYRFSLILAVICIFLGMILWVVYGITGPWLKGKIFLVILLALYYAICGYLVKKMQNESLGLRPTLLRVFNEFPVLIITGIIIFVIVKPI